MNRADSLLVPGSRIRLRPRADGAVPYLTLIDLNKVGPTYVKKVVEWLIKDYPDHFRQGDDYTVAADGYHITENGQVVIAKEIDTEWSWAVWKELRATVLKAKEKGLLPDAPGPLSIFD